MKLHGIPSSIILDKDLRFTSRFWESLQEALWAKLRLSSSYHLQTESQIEMTIHSLENLLKACVLEQRGVWDNFLLLIEFTYNNNFHSSIGMKPFEALYGRRCRTPLCCYESGESVVLEPEIFSRLVKRSRWLCDRMLVTKRVCPKTFWKENEFLFKSFWILLFKLGYDFLVHFGRKMNWGLSHKVDFWSTKSTMEGWFLIDQVILSDSLLFIWDTLWV